MYRVTDLNNENKYNKYSNFYDLKEATDNFNLKKENGLNVVLTIIKHKVLICDSILNHKYPGYDYYINSLDQIDYLIRSLLLGKEHIELFRVIGHWKDPKEIIDLVPILNNDYSVESVLYYCFDKLYPKSHFLSRFCVDLLHKYDAKEITKEEVTETIEHIKTISLCNKQKITLVEIIKKYIDL